MLVTVGVPVVVTVKVLGMPGVNVAVLALVMVGAIPVVKENTWFAAMFCAMLMSVTLAATTVTVHRTLPGSAAVGVSTKLAEGEAERLKVFGVPLGHSSKKDAPVAFTGSLKFTPMVPAVVMAVAPFTGMVEVTVGAASTVIAIVFGVAACAPPVPVLPLSLALRTRL